MCRARSGYNRTTPSSTGSKTRRGGFFVVLALILTLAGVVCERSSPLGSQKAVKAPPQVKKIWRNLLQGAKKQQKTRPDLL